MLGTSYYQSLKALFPRLILGQVGSPSPSLEVKLVNVEEMNYLASNLPNPQGELYVRGPSVTKGYHKQENITKEVFTEDVYC